MEKVNITRVEMCEGLMEEMAVEEQQAVEECTKVKNRESDGQIWKKVR